MKLTAVIMNKYYCSRTNLYNILLLFIYIYICQVVLFLKLTAFLVSIPFQWMCVINLTIYKLCKLKHHLLFHAIDLTSHQCKMRVHRLKCGICIIIGWYIT